MPRIIAIAALALLLVGCGFGPPPAQPHSGMPNGDIPGAAAGD